MSARLHVTKHTAGHSRKTFGIFFRPKCPSAPLVEAASPVHLPSGHMLNMQGMEG